MYFSNKNYIIGIDIGGSKINAVLFLKGKVIKNAKIPTPVKSRAGFLNDLEKVIYKVAPSKSKFFKIGCGIAGVLDLGKGIVLNSPNLKILNGFNIKNWMQKKFNCDVKIDNDARCFTRAEYLFGSGLGYKNVVGITLGTGIGGGIIINGKMFYGANDSTGEIGHMIIDHGQDLESLTVKYVRKIGKTNSSSKKFEMHGAVGIANIINILDPQVIIIGGGAGDMARFFLPEIKNIMNKFIISPKSRKNVKIITGQLGENAGAIGAMALFFHATHSTKHGTI